MSAMNSTIFTASTNSKDSNAATGRKPGQDGKLESRWPLGIAVGLGAVVLSNAVMISIAISHPSAPVDVDPFAASLNWDETRAQERRSRELGWDVDVERCDGPILVRARDEKGRPLGGLQLTGRLSRFDGVDADEDLEWAELGEGRYLATVPRPTSGLVSVELRAVAGEKRWAGTRRFECRRPAEAES